jgi:hypothetical protein
MVLVDIPQQGQVLQRMELSYIHTVELSSVFPEYQGLRIPYQAAPNNVKDFFRIGAVINTSVNLAGTSDDGTLPIILTLVI